MTINQALSTGLKKLKKSLKNPLLEAEILLAFVLKKPREFILAHPEKKLTKRQTVSFEKLLKKRSQGEPSAYLTGQKEFYGLDFFVNKNVLIPRTETELLVDETLTLTKKSAKPSAVIDVGTGSGCLIIALAKLLPESDHKFLAIDISKKALTVARQNAKKHQANKKIKFIQGNLLSPLSRNSKFLLPGSDLIILANLPYLTPVQIKNSPTIKHEPRLALSGGWDGLKFYRRLFREIKKLKKLSSADISLLSEIDPGQTGKMIKLSRRFFPQAKKEIKKDLAGRNRLVKITLL